MNILTHSRALLWSRQQERDGQGRHALHFNRHQHRLSFKRAKTVYIPPPRCYIYYTPHNTWWFYILKFSYLAYLYYCLFTLSFVGWSNKHGLCLGHRHPSGSRQEGFAELAALRAAICVGEFGVRKGSCPAQPPSSACCGPLIPGNAFNEDPSSPCPVSCQAVSAKLLRVGSQSHIHARVPWAHSWQRIGWRIWEERTTLGGGRAASCRHGWKWGGFCLHQSLP